MPEPNPSPSADVQLLGEIRTEIVGTPGRDIAIQPGEQVNLERESENTGDKNAIRVENRHFQPVGHLANDAASWLALLLDAGKIRLDGYMPRGDCGGGEQPAPHTRHLMLAVALTEKGRGLLEKAAAHNRQEELHQVVLHVYRGVHEYSDPQLVLQIAKDLRPLEKQELLPETRLLLALLPGIARELEAAHRMQGGR